MVFIASIIIFILFAIVLTIVNDRSSSNFPIFLVLGLWIIVFIFNVEVIYLYYEDDKSLTQIFDMIVNFFNKMRS